MIRELVQPTDPILRQECDKFDFADPQMDPKELEEMLKNELNTAEEKPVEGATSIIDGLNKMTEKMKKEDKDSE